MKFYLSLILLGILPDISIEILNESPVVEGCPPVTPMQRNVSLNLMNGTWYEISKDESSFRPGKCVTVKVQSVSARNISISYSQIFGTEIQRNNVSIAKFNATMLSSYFWAAAYKSLYSKFKLSIRNFIEL